MAKTVFDGDFTQQDALPAESIAAANEALASARLHRYNQIAGEDSEAALLEREYAAYQQRTYCLALSSCGQALQISLRALGVKANDKVLTNAFTLAPVPGSIAALGAKPIFIETTRDLKLDIDDLAKKAAEHKGCVLLLSHMRGHISDMHDVIKVAERFDLKIVEDCAHTMGARWGGVSSGNFGEIGCFSTQTYKHMNSGEGGFLVTDNKAIIAKAIFLSGSYMLYAHHGTIPEDRYFEDVQPQMPNLSARMDNLRAAILRPQLHYLPERIAQWNQRYDAIHKALSNIEGVYLPRRHPSEHYVGSSIQFLLPEASEEKCVRLVKEAISRGVVLKWFGAPKPAAFTSSYRNWHYAPAQQLTMTDSILSGLFDMRIPLSFSLDDCLIIANILAEEIEGVHR